MLRHLANNNVKADILTGAVEEVKNRHEALITNFGRLFRVQHNLLTPLLNPVLTNNSTKKRKSLIRFSESKSPPLFSLGKSIKKNIFPDSYVFSVPVLTMKATKLMKEDNYDAVITSASPFSTFFVGWYLKIRFPQVKWIMDLGDPWSYNPALLWSAGFRNRFAVTIERTILRCLDGLVVTTPETRDLYESELSSKSRPFQIAVVANGVDCKRYNEVQLALNRMSNNYNHFECVRFVYTGKFLDDIREPFSFYRALEMLDRKTLKNIRIEVYGNTPKRFRCHFQRIADMKIIHYHETVANHEIARLQSEADILLLFGNGSSYQLPSKVFEYAAAKRPILCIKQRDGDIAANFVQRHELGWVVNNCKNEIAGLISKIVSKQLYNTPFYPKLDINSISWEARTEKFYRFLKRVCHQTPC